MENNITADLGFNEILLQASKHCVTQIGSRSILNSKPNNSLKKAEEQLSLTNECYKLINVYLVSPLQNLSDISDICDKLKIGYALSIPEIINVFDILRVSRICKSSIENLDHSAVPNLLALTQSITIHKNIETLIDKSIQDDTSLKSTASNTLASIRQSISRTQSKIKDKLQQILKSSGKYLQDNIISVRSDRFVIPVRAEHKGNVAGFVHDTSNSGQTLFIEPIAVLELNNELKELASREIEEVNRILSAISLELKNILPQLHQNINIITWLDIALAKAHYASSIKANLPILNGSGIIELKQARHPLLDRSTCVPIDISLGKSFDILVITGPNTGGKTVALKTVGLMSLMASVGMFLPCESAQIAIFEKVFCDIGDSQSISQNLSTFSSHITNIVRILEKVNKNSLVLLDELGSGTAPHEGAALSVAITESILKVGCKAIITSHFAELKEYSLTAPRIEKGAFEFDNQTLTPTYRLIMGMAGSSNALEISSKLGLSKAIIDKARSLLSEERVKLDNVLKKAQQSESEANKAKEESLALKHQLDKELYQVRLERESLKQQREKLLGSAEKEAKRIKQEAHNKADRVIKEVTSLANSFSDANIFKARELKNSLLKENEEEVILPTVDLHNYKKPDRPLKNGDKVYVKSFASEGIITNIKGSNISVNINNILITTKLTDILLAKNIIVNKPIETKAETIKKHTKKEKQEKSSIDIYAAEPLDIQAEINLIGQNVQEAIIAVDSFIVNCIHEELQVVRVIHGMGSGILRQGLHNHFKRQKAIKNFRLGRIGEGDSGATIIELK